MNAAEFIATTQKSLELIAEDSEDVKEFLAEARRVQISLGNTRRDGELRKADFSKELKAFYEGREDASN